MSPQIPALGAPFVVAVTGHKDILDPEVLEVAFTEKLAELKREAGTADCILLSALAEGADTLAADIALKPEQGWKVIVPLPLPKEDYERDFVESKLEKTKGAALKKFNELLGHENCSHFFIGYAPECKRENTQADGEHRDRQYAYLGEFLTRHCEVLIAFWDGQDAGGIGGTGYVVNLQRRGLAGYSIDLRPDGILLDAPETGRTFAIWSKRKKHKTADAPFNKIANGKTHGEWEELPHGLGESTPEQAEATLLPKRRLGRKRKSPEELELEKRQERRKQWSEFVEEANKVEYTSEAEPQELKKYQPLPLGSAWKDEYLARVRDAFLRADKLASHFQAVTKREFLATMAVVLAFTLCVAGAGAYAESRWNMAMLVASWGLLAGAYGISRWQKKSGDAGRHQDYRALAEAWRVAFFWRALGIAAPLDTCYLRSQRGELDWIRHALRTTDLQWRAARRDPKPDANGEPNECGYPEPSAREFDVAFEKWIEDQTGYFDKNVPQSRVNLTSLRNWSWALLILGLIASAFEALVRVKGAQVTGAAGLWQWTQNFASADLLASPFVPALLLALRMNAWPIATDKNTKVVRADTAKQKDKRRKLRQEFVRRNAEWTFVAVASGLLVLGAALAIHVGLLPVPASGRAPFLQMLETFCFFLPSLIYVAAEHEALPEQVENYERMSAIFARAKKMLGQLDENSKPENGESNSSEVQNKARRIYQELGREALHENGEWLLIHRDRPLDVEI